MKVHHWLLLFGFSLCCLGSAQGMKRDDALSPTSRNMAQRFVTAFAEGDASAVNALLSAKGRREIRAAATAPLPFRTLSPATTAKLKAIFGTDDHRGLTDSEFTLKLLSSVLVKQPGLSGVVLGGAPDGEEGIDYVVVKWKQPDASPAITLVEVCAMGQDQGVSAIPELLRFAGTLLDEPETR